MPARNSKLADFTKLLLRLSACFVMAAVLLAVLATALGLHVPMLRAVQAPGTAKAVVSRPMTGVTAPAGNLSGGADAKQPPSGERESLQQRIAAFCAAQQAEAEELAGQHVQAIAEEIDLSNDEKERLRWSELLGRKRNCVDVSDEQFEKRFGKIESLAEILGAERAARVENAESEPFDREQFELLEKEVAYLAAEAKLSDQQQLKLKSVLLDPDADMFAYAAFLAQRFAMTGEEENALVQALRAVDNSEDAPEQPQATRWGQMPVLLRNHLRGKVAPELVARLVAYIQEDNGGVLPEAVVESQTAGRQQRQAAPFEQMDAEGLCRACYEEEQRMYEDSVRVQALRVAASEEEIKRLIEGSMRSSECSARDLSDEQCSALIGPIETAEKILGTERARVYEGDSEESQRRDDLSEEYFAVYIARELSASPGQKEKLRELLNNPDLFLLSEAHYLRGFLSLSAGQEEKVRRLLLSFSDDFSPIMDKVIEEHFAGQESGLIAEDAEYTPALDAAKKKFAAEKFRSILNDEQYNKWLEYSELIPGADHDPYPQLVSNRR